MTERKFVPGMGNGSAKLFILGEAPSYVEEGLGEPFKGPAGKELDYLLKDVGISRLDTWVSNVFKYSIPPNVGKKKIPAWVRARQAGIDVDEQLQWLQTEINEIKPNCILGLGNTALWALAGKDKKIGDYRGSIMRGMGRKFVCTYHPAHLLHSAADAEFKGHWNRFVMMFDFKRASIEANNPELDLPPRHIEICRDSAQLAAFRDRYKDKIKMAVDIEAGGHCLPICIGLAHTKHHAIVIPLWNKDGISNIPDADLTSIWIILAEMLYEKEIIGQNFNYDRDKIRRLGFIIRKLRSDIMLKAFAINPELPKNLAFNTSLYTREPFYKNEGMYHGELKDLFHGCGKDACVTVEVDEAMDPDLDELNQRAFYENFLMTLPDFYLEIENNGLNINLKKRDELLRKYIEWTERNRYELFRLTGAEINTNSPKQVWTLLFENWHLPQRPGTGEEELTALLNLQNGIKNPDHRRGVELILEDRRVRRTISNNIMALPDYDGKMRTTCFPCLETGRSSTGQQEKPIRPEIEVTQWHNGKKIKKAMGTPFQTMTKHGDIGSDIRGQYEPDEGWIFVNVDSSQAEARVVFLLANDEQALKDIDEHDYHALTASWFFGGNEDDYSKRILGYESPIRFAGKTLRHAGHLGAGKRRAATSVNTDARKYKIPITITEADADRALKIFHAKQPSIQQVFHAGVINALKEARRLVAPLPWGVDAPIGGVRTFYERWGDELFRQAFSYIPQRAVTDNTKAAGIRTKKRFSEALILMESHDAVLFQVRIDTLKEFIPIVRQEMERPINFRACSLPRRSLVIPCDIEIGENYKDFKKFKDYEKVSA